METIFRLAKKHNWNKTQLEMLYKKKRLTKAEYDELVERLDRGAGPAD